MRSKNILSYFLLFAFLLASATSFAFPFDVVGQVAIKSFDVLIKNMPDQVICNPAKGGWVINGPDGKERLIINRDFSAGNADIAIEFDATPFLKAGLDVSKLPEPYHFDKATQNIILPFDIGRDKFSTAGSKSALATFKQIVKTHRDIIIYHQQGDHYGIALDSNNMFAWAKELKGNPKDLVFALNPQPLIEADADPGKIKEWVFAKIEMMDKDGRAILVDRFVKGFNIK